MSSGMDRQETLNVTIRWMIRRDMAEVLQIERDSFDFQWTEADFLHCLRQRNCIGMVAEQDHQVVGFIIYELFKTRLHVLNFAVAPWARRNGIGSQIIERLIQKLSQQRRDAVTLEVRETNLPAQLFFKSHGFRARQVLRDHYPDTNEDAYLMEFSLFQLEDCDDFQPRNRMVGLEEEV